jgi:hypothetical protein
MHGDPLGRPVERIIRFNEVRLVVQSWLSADHIPMVHAEANHRISGAMGRVNNSLEALVYIRRFQLQRRFITNESLKVFLSHGLRVSKSKRPSLSGRTQLVS